MCIMVLFLFIVEVVSGSLNWLSELRLISFFCLVMWLMVGWMCRMMLLFLLICGVMLSVMLEK